MRKTKENNPQRTAIRISMDTAKKIHEIIRKINAKEYGQRIKAETVLDKAISLLTDQDIKELQESTMTNMDRIDIAYRDYCAENGHVSKDEYLGLVIAGKLAIS